MEYRGHILIVFGLSLIMSPLAIRLVTEAHASGPSYISTVGGEESECNSRGIDTAIGRLGCGTIQSTSGGVRRIDQTMNVMNRDRRFEASGAMFMPARN